MEHQSSLDLPSRVWLDPGRHRRLSPSAIEAFGKAVSDCPNQLHVARIKAQSAKSHLMMGDTDGALANLRASIEALGVKQQNNQFMALDAPFILENNERPRDSGLRKICRASRPSLPARTGTSLP